VKGLGWGVEEDDEEEQERMGKECDAWGGREGMMMVSVESGGTGCR